jgi:hypothetical protein
MVFRFFFVFRLLSGYNIRIVSNINIAELTELTELKSLSDVSTFTSYYLPNYRISFTLYQRLHMYVDASSRHASVAVAQAFFQ